MPIGSHRHRSSLVFLLAALVTGCGGERPADRAEEPAPPDPGTACLAATPLPVALAVQDFIMTADPAPQRFLQAAATDSALPPAAEAVVSAKGPLFYWTGDAAAQEAMRAKLEGDGPWINMLVVVREQRDEGTGTWTVRVGGHYIGGALHGTVSPGKRYTVSCVIGEPSAWTVTDAQLSGDA